MAWTIILEDENKEPIITLSNELDIRFNDFKSNFKLICYLDAYGDTIFNRLQMDDLIKDLQRLNLIQANPLLDEIKILAERCKNGEHTYLAFYGD
jgi:hypothetical protein